MANPKYSLERALEILDLVPLYNKQLQDIKTLPRPYGLHYAKVNKEKGGWDYVATNIGLSLFEELDKAVATIKEFVAQHVNPEDKKKIEYFLGNAPDIVKAADPDQIERTASNIYLVKMLERCDMDDRKFAPWVDLTEDQKEVWRGQAVTHLSLDQMQRHVAREMEKKNRA